MNDERFDRVIGQMRDESAAPDQIEEARERVWRRLQGAAPLACEQLRPMLDDYAHGRLAEARRMLVKDHLGRCVDCRHALAEVEGRGRHAEVTVLPTRPRWVRWAVAASILLAVAFLGRQSLDTAFAPSGPRATVESIAGTLLGLSEGQLQVGAELADGDIVRTAAGSHAVLRLADGSRLEMNGRTELAVRGAWSGDTVRLRRGDVVVRAAEQGRRRLRVLTHDSVATVRGTVFAVSSAAAGSLVSVVEGEVAVSQPGFERLLGAGQQAASNPALAHVGFEQALSWSQDADDFRALLADLGEVEQQMASLTGSALRYEPRLLPYLPDGVIGYAAVPNVDGAVEEALRLVDERAQPGSPLDAWLRSEDGRQVWRAMESLGSVSALLGDEIVVVLADDAVEEGGEGPWLMAEIVDGGAEQLRRQLDDLSAEADDDLPYRIDGNLLLVAATNEQLAIFASEIGLGAGSSFAVEIAARYRDGVAWLAAGDLSVVERAAETPDEARALRALGLTNARYLLVEQKSTDLGDQSRATLSFAGRRAGVASWLGSPGPLGSAEFISADVIVAMSAATREPREALDQLLDRLGPNNEFAEAIEELEQETGIRLGDDIADSLGTDFTVAIEEPTVPTPGWLVVMEVLDAPALDAAMERLVDAVNAEADAEGEGHLVLERETVNGQTWRSLSSPDDDFPGLEWTYHLGYLVAAADRPLALRAIAVRNSGASLVNSADFERGFPDGSGLHSSGFVWANPGRLAGLAALADGSEATAWLSAIESREPVLVVVSGEPDRVLSASRTRLTGMLVEFVVGAFASRAAD